MFPTIQKIEDIVADECNVTVFDHIKTVSHWYDNHMSTYGNDIFSSLPLFALKKSENASATVSLKAATAAGA